MLAMMVLCLLAFPPLPTGEQLLREGDRLADEGSYDETLARYTRAYQLLLPGMRGLRFQKPVAPRILERSALREHVRGMVRARNSAQALDLLDAGLKVFGFVARDHPTLETILELYADVVSGFYDPVHEQMFLVKEAARPGLTGALAGLLGAGGGFDKGERKGTLVHEMTHALAYQNFDLLKQEEAARHDDDRLMALHALIEGEAMLINFVEVDREAGGDLHSALDMPPQVGDMAFRMMSWVLPFTAGKAFNTAPAIFRDTMVFPYHHGLVFTLHLTHTGGWREVDRAYRTPPLSTEQILHPEKYLDRPDWPTEVCLPPLPPPAGWARVGEDTLGELQTSILLTPAAATGWDGDRFAVYRGPAGALGLVWYTTWDTAVDAKEFADAYQRRVPHARVERRVADVVVVHGFAVEDGDSLRRVAWEAKKRPKR